MVVETIIGLSLLVVGVALFMYESKEDKIQNDFIEKHNNLYIKG